jgi:hypothetical protein
MEVRNPIDLPPTVKYVTYDGGVHVNVLIFEKRVQRTFSAAAFHRAIKRFRSADLSRRYYKNERIDCDNKYYKHIVHKPIRRRVFYFVLF